MKHKKKIFFVAIFFVIFFLFSLSLVLSSNTNSYLYLNPNYIAIDEGEEVELIIGLFDYEGLQGCAEVESFSLGLCHNNKVSITSTKSILYDPIVGEPSFIDLETYDTGLTYSIVWPFLAVCRNTGYYNSVLIHYKGKTSGITELNFCNSLGNPAVDTTLEINGNAYNDFGKFGSKIIIGDVDKDGFSGKKDNCPEIANPNQEDSDNDGIGDACEKEIFKRGDTNSDGRTNIADAVYILHYLFKNATCLSVDSMDTNDDGKINIDDSIYLLTFLFRLGEPLPQPFPNPGLDLTKDDLICGNKENKKLNEAIAELEKNEKIAPEIKKFLATELEKMLPKGDINRDCETGILDLVILGMNYNKYTKDINNKRADINNDGAVNILDLVVLGQNYGRVC